MLAKYNFHDKIHNWTHHSQVEMWWLWAELAFFTPGTAKYIFFSCHSYNSYLCNRENIRPESGILIHSFHFLYHSLFCISKGGRFACKVAGSVFKVLQKSDIGMFLVFFFIYVYCTKLLADVDDASLDTFCSLRAVWSVQQKSLTRPSVLLLKNNSLCRRLVPLFLSSVDGRSKRRKRRKGNILGSEAGD